jgi:hypothetical protein
MFVIGHVAGNAHCGTASLANLAGDTLCIGFRKIIDDDTGAALSKRQRMRASQSLACSGDSISAINAGVVSFSISTVTAVFINHWPGRFSSISVIFDRARIRCPTLTGAR